MGKFEFNDVVKTQLEKSARWAKFLSFFGFFIVALYIINFLIMLVNSHNVDYLVALIIYIIMLIPCLYLYYFSKKITTSISKQDIKELESSFENLAKFFHFVGIFVLIIITLSVFQILMMY